MATIAVGDIHGSVTPLRRLLARLFEETAVADTVVFLGDYIDRGSESRACVDEILTFRRDSPAQVVCLLGNHEDWLLRTQNDHSRHSWLTGMEALDTIQSYSPEASTAIRSARAEAGLRLYLGKCTLPYQVFFDAMPASHRSFFSALPLFHESPDCWCSHAGLDPEVEGLAGQSPEALVWGHRLFPDRYSGPTTVVYGHWNNAVPADDGWPRPKVVNNTIGVDTIAHGLLSAVRLPDRRVFQSNGSEVRSFTI
jgi:calcineurin-like phosphoesterase family protein